MTRHEDLLKQVVGILNSTKLTRDELFENILRKMSEDKLQNMLFELKAMVNQGTI